MDEERATEAMNDGPLTVVIPANPGWYALLYGPAKYGLPERVLKDEVIAWAIIGEGIPQAICIDGRRDDYDVLAPSGIVYAMGIDEAGTVEQWAARERDIAAQDSTDDDSAKVEG